MKKNKKRTLFSLLALSGLPLMLVGLLTNFWALNINGTISDNEKYKLFDKIPKTFINLVEAANNTYQEIWRTLLIVTVSISLLALAVYMVFTLLEFLGAKKANTNLFKKASSYFLIISSVLILIFGLLFSLLNAGKFLTVPYSLQPDIGFYAMVLGPAVAGILGLTATKHGNSTKKKTTKKKAVKKTK